MLILSRKRDESILIGDDIEITVTEIRGDKVRLGIRAPKGVAVHRKEVAERIKRETAFWCDCPKPPGALNIARIVVLLGGTATCIECGRSAKPAVDPMEEK